MADRKNRKELLAQYKERRQVGGVYVIRNTETDKMLLECDSDLQGSRNRFQFMYATNTPPTMKLGADWRKYGMHAFVFEVLEELEKKPEQSAEEFRADLETLCELWREKLSEREFY